MPKEMDSSRVSVQLCQGTTGPYVALCVDGLRIPGLISSDFQCLADEISIFTGSFYITDGDSRHGNSPKEKPAGTDDHVAQVSRADGR